MFDSPSFLISELYVSCFNNFVHTHFAVESKNCPYPVAPDDLLTAFGFHTFNVENMITIFTKFVNASFLIT